ncbi:hypothetical protein HY407_02900 [Candidatus Gottesmanbacteria bacterium]|nr:hypothetical protein [Candidatus Gottesmanbacteria bacterium]
MKRDTLAAIVIGFIFGLAVALGFLILPSLLKDGMKFSFSLPKISLPKSSPKTTPTPKVIEQTGMSITEPKDNSISQTSKINLSGKSPKKSLVVISTPSEDKVLDLGSDGRFTTDITLAEGVNTIYITSYVDGNIADNKSLNIYYTPEKF